MKRTFAAILALVLLILTVGCAELDEITTTLPTEESTTSEETTSAQTTTESEETTEEKSESTETKKPTTESTIESTEATEPTTEGIVTTTEVAVPTTEMIEATEPTTEVIETTTEAETQHLQIVSYESKVSRNEVVTLTANGKPNTTYHITVNYKSGPSTAEGLEDKTSNSSGFVSWTWKIGGRTSAGTYSIVVSGGGESETVYFTVETE